MVSFKRGSWRQRFSVLLSVISYDSQTVLGNVYWEQETSFSSLNYIAKYIYKKVVVWLQMGQLSTWDQRATILGLRTTLINEQHPYG